MSPKIDPSAQPDYAEHLDNQAAERRDAILQGGVAVSLEHYNEQVDTQAAIRSLSVMETRLVENVRKVIKTKIE